jgi:hypothetical protein
MTEQLLNDFHVLAGLTKMRSNRMPERVPTDRLGYLGGDRGGSLFRWFRANGTSRGLGPWRVRWILLGNGYFFER